MITPPSRNPIPTARPTHAHAHKLAAVVSPLTWCPDTMMVPTPRNPTPLITCDAIRERSDFPGKYTSIYCAVNITSVAPRHTIVFVFVPAPRFFNPLSRPITHPSIMETTILIKTLGIPPYNFLFSYFFYYTISYFYMLFSNISIYFIYYT